MGRESRIESLYIYPLNLQNLLQREVKQAVPTVYDVPSDLLIQRLGDYLLTEVPKVTPPKWVSFAKTSAHVEGPPMQRNWWHTRCASLLRKTYIQGPVGIARLKKAYGGRKSKGSVGKHSRPGGGAIVRHALQQLEEAGLVRTVEGEGRVLTRQGKSLLDRLAVEVKKTLEKDVPGLAKYG